MWRELVTTGSWHDTFGREVGALKTALLGSTNSDSPSNNAQQQVTLPAFLTRSDEAVKDLLRLAVAPVLILQGVNLAVSQSVGLMFLDPAFAASADTAAAAAAVVADADPLSGFLWSAANVAIILLGYMSVALPATRVVLRERDDHLATGIRAACRIAPSGGRVVAVLGLLHVNGVARRLLDGVETNAVEHRASD